MWARALAALVLASFLSCDRIHEHGVIRFRVDVETQDHEVPIKAAVHFRDVAAQGGRELLVCSTDQAGRCVGEIRYSYDRNVYPWSGWFSNPSARSRFTFIVTTPGVTRIYPFAPTRNEMNGVENAALTFDIKDRVLRRRITAN